MIDPASPEFVSSSSKLARRRSSVRDLVGPTLLGLLGTPILVVGLGSVLLSGHPTMNSGQGVGLLLTAAGLMTAPLGAIYWLLIVMRRGRRLDAGLSVGPMMPAAVYLAAILAIIGTVAVVAPRP